MSIYWVRFQGDSAAEAMNAIAEALRNDEHGVVPDQEQAPPAPPADNSQVSSDGDRYLQANVQAMRTLWSIDPMQVELPSDRRFLVRLGVHLQHWIRRLTRWYFMTPWLQANEFHAAVTRVIDVLLVRQQQLQQELHEYQYRLQATEQQVQLLRNELALSRQQLMEIRQQQALYQNIAE